MSQSYTAKDWPIFLQIGHFLQTYNIPEAWLMVCVILHPLTIGDAGCSSSPAKLWPQGAPVMLKPGNGFSGELPRHRSCFELGSREPVAGLESVDCPLKKAYSHDKWTIDRIIWSVWSSTTLLEFSAWKPNSELQSPQYPINIPEQGFSSLQGA